MFYAYFIRVKNNQKILYVILLSVCFYFFFYTYQVGMMNPAQDGLAPPGGAPSYQQPLYLQEPHTPVTSHRLLII